MLLIRYVYKCSLSYRTGRGQLSVIATSGHAVSFPDITPIAELFERLVALAEREELRVSDAGFRRVALAWTLSEHLQPSSPVSWSAEEVAQCSYALLAAGDREALAPLAAYQLTALTEDPPGPETPAELIRYAFSKVQHIPRQSALRGDLVGAHRTPELVRRLAMWLAFDEFSRNLGRTDARLASRSSSAFRPERSEEIRDNAELMFRTFLIRSRQEGIVGALDATLELESAANPQRLRVPDAAWLIAWDEAVRAGADTVCSELAGHRARRQTHSLERDFWSMLQAVYTMRERLPLSTELEEGLRRVQKRNDATSGLATELLIGLSASREVITREVRTIDRNVEGDALHLAQMLLNSREQLDRDERLARAGAAGQLLSALLRDIKEQMKRPVPSEAARATQAPVDLNNDSGFTSSLDLPAVEPQLHEAPLFTGGHGALSQPLSSDALSTASRLGESRTLTSKGNYPGHLRETPGEGVEALEGGAQLDPADLRSLLSRAQYALTVEDADELAAVDREMGRLIALGTEATTALETLLHEDAEHLPLAAARLSERYAVEERWNDAAELLERVARLEDDQRKRGALYQEIAKRWLKAGEFNYAHEQLLVSFMCDPLNPHTIKLLEVSYRKRGVPEAAIEMYETAIQSAELAGHHALAEAMHARVETLRERHHAR